MFSQMPTVSIYGDDSNESGIDMFMRGAYGF